MRETNNKITLLLHNVDRFGTHLCYCLVQNMGSCSKGPHPKSPQNPLKSSSQFTNLVKKLCTSIDGYGCMDGMFIKLALFTIALSCPGVPIPKVYTQMCTLGWIGFKVQVATWTPTNPITSSRVKVHECKRLMGLGVHQGKLIIIPFCRVTKCSDLVT